jgi:hypothetical protein
MSGKIKYKKIVKRAQYGVECVRENPRFRLHSRVYSRSLEYGTQIANIVGTKHILPEALVIISK